MLPPSGRTPARRPRRLLAAGAALISLAALTACGGSSAEGEDTLDVWIMEGTNPDARPYFEDLEAEFTEQTGVALDIQYIQWADAHDRFTNAMAAGELPDVAEFGTTWAAEFAEAGVLTDLTGRISDAGLDDDLVPALAEAGTVDGSLYGMPWYAGVRSLIYRKDVFEKHNLEAPTTWEELRDVAGQLKDLEPGMISFPVAGDNEYGVYPFIWGAGGDIAEQDADGDWHSTLNSAAAVEGIEFYTSLATEDDLSVAAATTWDEADLLESFQNGESAMIIGGNWTISSLVEDDPAWEDKIGVVTLPGQDGGTSPSFVGGSLLGDFNSDEPDLAWELIQMMSTGEYGAKWADQSGYFPGQQSALEEVQQEDDPLVAPFATQMNEAGATVPVTEQWGAIQGEKIVPQMLQSILTGEKTVQQAADDAAADMDEAFAD